MSYNTRLARIKDCRSAAAPTSCLLSPLAIISALSIRMRRDLIRLISCEWEAVFLPPRESPQTSSLVSL